MGQFPKWEFIIAVVSKDDEPLSNDVKNRKSAGHDPDSLVSTFGLLVRRYSLAVLLVGFTSVDSMNLWAGPVPPAALAPAAPAAPAVLAPAAVSAPSTAQAVASPPLRTLQSQPRRVDVAPLTNRYWNANAPDANVVQNRIYKKNHRASLNVNYSMLSHDPFLTTSGIGGTLGYNFSEEIGFHLVYWKISEANSSAVTSLESAERQSGGTPYAPNLNPIKSIFGGEVSWAILYGKLSLLGKAILHFDFFLMGGAGSLSTQNGSAIGGWLGLGQQIYLTTSLAFRVDYRLLIYSEKLYEINDVATKGHLLETRTTMAPTVSLGLSLYF